jgi:hypothetical protein
MKAEFEVLAAGVQVYQQSQARRVWIYGKVCLFSADSQARWTFSGTNPPGGMANYCCPNCTASREMFSKGEVGLHRDFDAASSAVKRAINLLEDDPKKAVQLVEEQHLNWRAIFNPLFDWPDIGDLFSRLPPDPLHLVLFYFKVLYQIQPTSSNFTNLFLIPVLKCI